MGMREAREVVRRKLGRKDAEYDDNSFRIGAGGARKGKNRRRIPRKTYGIRLSGRSLEKSKV